ncbi:MAG: DUF4397 domain-containing protein [Peptostreptococcaceae bacterium]
MRNFNKNYSLIRVLHAVPGGDAVDIYLNDKPFYKGIDFTEFTPYIYVPQGKYILTIYRENTLDDPIVNEEIEVSNGGLSTIAIINDGDVIKALPIEEDKEIAEGNNSKIRFVHLVPNGREVNIIIDNIPEFKNIEFKDITEYMIVPPKEYVVDVAVSQNDQIIKSDKVNVNPNRIYTFYAIGNAPNFDIIQSVDGATFLI